MVIRWSDVSEEWGVEGMHETELNGIYAEYRAPDLMTSETGTNDWWWMVKPTGKRSEYPEVYNCGLVASEEEARRQAEESLHRADASYGHPFKEEVPDAGDMLGSDGLGS